MKIATWNVNSIRARLPIALDWLKENKPDVVLLQELKCTEDDFPKSCFHDLGYNMAIYGQKTYNGVAILSHYPIDDVLKGIPDFEDDAARYIEAVIGTTRIASVYVPNGQEVGAEKYDYKMAFLEKLNVHLKKTLTYGEKFILGGDFNIAPQPEDIKCPGFTNESILCSPKERHHFQGLLNLGLYDAIYHHHKDDLPMTWWDYRQSAFAKGHGLRIDHLLLSGEAADVLSSSYVDASVRGLEKASDHAPVLCTLR
jgi:exodeoxyribonuclease-3